MSKIKHTPGPWVSVDGTTTGRAVIAPDEPKVRRNVAMVGGQNRDGNASLIAAAPDLLEALHGLMEWVIDHAVKPAEITELTDARAAIAKAEASK